MVDAKVESNEDLVSEFIVSTCQLLPKPYSLAVDRVHDSVMAFGKSPKSYSVFCGSIVEFYIRPLNTCISDVDYLMWRSDLMAFCGDFPVLPSDRSGLSDTITWYRIEPYLWFPGFVKLREFGELKFNWESKEYELKNTVKPGFYTLLTLGDPSTSQLEELSHSILGNTLPPIINGPAYTFQRHSDLYFGSDAVRSLICPQWPEEARNWSIRRRKYGWPTMDAISEIVQNGCHVVRAKHRSCRDDEFQFRLSFSVAEVILIQSWTKTQQIIYHLLRFFAKRELISKDCPKENAILCTYHIKTLMLWACEEMPPEWWNSSSVIVKCIEMLQYLSEWLKSMRCPNYFIPEANLFNEPLNNTLLHKTKRKLNEFQNVGILSDWFIENYILPIVQVQFTYSNTRKVKPDFVEYLQHLIKCRQTNILQSLDFFFSKRFKDFTQIYRSAVKFKANSGIRQRSQSGQYVGNFSTIVHIKMRHLPAIENVLCFKFYDNLLYILNSAYYIHSGELLCCSDLFVEFISAISKKPKILKSEYHNFPKPHAARTFRVEFQSAQTLMENLTGLNSTSEFQFLSLVSKEFLSKALEYEDSKSNGIASAAIAYLAALCYVKSDYQEARKLCLQVLVNQIRQKNKETLNAGSLFFIDDIVRIVGLNVLYERIRGNNTRYTYYRRLYFDLRIAPEVFAHYLYAISTPGVSTHLDYALPHSMFPMDKYLMALLHPKCRSGTHLKATGQIVYRRTCPLTETESTNETLLMSTETLFNVLMEYALENMNSFYSVIGKDFGIQCNTTDCYRALHLYKRRQHVEVLRLCERILGEPDLRSDLKELSLANVLILPPLLSFFDEDVHSLLGFHTLFYYLSPPNGQFRKSEISHGSTFDQWFAHEVYIDKCPLSVFIVRRYPIKRNYVLGRHFLARYLKVRCCIDCNKTHAEALTEFAGGKTNLPFEKIIRRFLLRKFRNYQN